MADSQEFKILITSTADNTGFNQAAQGAGELTKAQAGVVEVTEKDIKAALGDKEETEKLEISKRELRETLRQLGPQFGILGEIGGLAFNPITLAVGGLFLGLRSISEIAEKVTDNLSQIQMPDFDLAKVDAAARSWNGIAEAIANAKEAMSGAETQYNARIAQIERELSLQKALNKARGLDDTGAEIKADGDKLAAKYAEQLNYQNTATNKANAAAAIKLPESDEDAKAQIDQEKERIKTLKEEAEKRQKNLEFIQDLQDQQAHGETPVVDLAKYAATYGTTPVDEAAKSEADQKRQAEDAARGVQHDIARREKLLAQRTKLRGEADTNQTKATELEGQLPGLAADTNIKEVVTQLNQPVAALHVTLAQLAAQTGKTNEQTIALVQGILNHTLNLSTVIAQLTSQLSAQQRKIDEQARGGSR